MRNPPQVWDWMCARWCPVPTRLAWVWWRALSGSRCRATAAWREALLDFDKPDRTLSRDLVERFFEEIATPSHLIHLLEQLQQEGQLLRRDSHQLQELVLRRTDKHGRWAHEQEGRTA